MEKKNNKYTALLNVMKRELRRLVSRPLYLFCMVIAPLFCYIFFTTLMDSGLPYRHARRRGGPGHDRHFTPIGA